MPNRSSSFLLLMAAAFLLTACGQAANHSQGLVMESSISNFKQTEQNRWIAGQPTEDELKVLAANGITTVINLRPQSEWPFDEAALAKQLGLTYHHIPVAGAAGITSDNAKQLHGLLVELGDEPTLLHCASANRVGALIALAEAVENGQPLSTAIATGKQWGLTGLEPVVIAQIQQLKVNADD